MQRGSEEVSQSRALPCGGADRRLGTGSGRCGSSSSKGPVNLNFYSSPDPNGTNVNAAKECSQASGGKYKIAFLRRQQRRRHPRAVVRRLAAGDKNMDIINMDTIYTPGVRRGGVDEGDDGRRRRDALDDVLPGPKSVTWKNKVYGDPAEHERPVALVPQGPRPNPPKTWDEMIAMAKKLPAGEGNILEQGQKYEGYVVWFNNLVASAGGTIVNAEGKPTLGDAGGQGRADHPRRRHLRPRRPVALHRAGGPGPARLRGRQGRVPAQLALRVGRRPHGRQDQPGDQEGLRRTWATRPTRVNPSEPSRVSIGGANLGVPKYGQEPRARDQGRALHDPAEVAEAGGHQRGPAAGHESIL